MTLRNFAIKKSAREDITLGLTTDGVVDNKGFPRLYFNELMYRASADWVLGTQAQVIAGTANIYSDGGDLKDIDNVIVTLSDDDRIAIVYDQVLTADYVINGQSKRLNIYTEKGFTFDGGADAGNSNIPFKIVLNSADRSTVNIQTTKTIDDILALKPDATKDERNSFVNNTTYSNIKINGRDITLVKARILDRSLKVAPNSTNPNNQIDITDFIFTLYNDEYDSLVLNIPLLTLDIEVSGAGGLATGEVEASDTWYYVYVYSDKDGNYNGLLSEFEEWASIVNKPSGAEFYRRVSVVRNDVADFRNFRQNGKEYLFETSSNSNITTSSTVEAQIDISAYAPRHIAAISGWATNQSLVRDIFIYSSPENPGSVINYQGGLFHYTSRSGGDNRAYFEVAIIEQQTIYATVGFQGGTALVLINRFIISL
jgi:hypothetical protein